MGCISGREHSGIIRLDDFNYEALREAILDANLFYEQTETNLYKISKIYEKIDIYLIEFLSLSQSSGTLEYKLAECYLYIILSLLHSCRSGSQTSQNDFIFSNYIPGIIVKQDFLSEILEKKYQNLVNLCKVLPGTFKELDELGQVIVDDIVKARDGIPDKILSIAKENSDISIVNFGRLERNWLSNLQIIGDAGKRLDKVFKDAKNCLIVANKVIEKSAQNTQELIRIIDEIDEWNYAEIPKIIQEGTKKFINDHLGISKY
jgi:hypothetical protein